MTAVAKALVEHDKAVQTSLVNREPLPKQTESSNPLCSEDLQQRTKEAFAAAPRFVLLDFRCGPKLRSGAGLAPLIIWYGGRQSTNHAKG